MVSFIETSIQHCFASVGTGRGTELERGSSENRLGVVRSFIANPLITEVRASLP